MIRGYCIHGRTFECWWAGLLVCWLAGWLVGWFAGWLVGWLAGERLNMAKTFIHSPRMVTAATYLSYYRCRLSKLT